MTRIIYIMAVFSLMFGLVHALVPMGGDTTRQSLFISGNVTYPGTKLISNIRVQLVSVATGDVLSENPTDAGGAFFIISDVTAPVYVVALADVVGGSDVLYGSPGGFLSPQVFDPQQSSSFETGIIELQDLAPPSRDVLGEPYADNGRAVYPLYHYVFVYDWLYSNHLYREGDNLFYTKHVHRHQGELIESVLPEPILWAKVDNLQNGDAWQRVEIVDYSGGMVIFIFRYYEYMQQDENGNHPVKLLVQTNCHNIMYSKTLTKGQDVQRWWYINDWVVSRENVTEPVDPGVLAEGKSWYFQGLATELHPTELVYDPSLIFSDPRTLTLNWQAPAMDATHVWTCYRIYRDNEVFAEVPFTQTQWTGTLLKGQSYSLSVCATDGTNNSASAGTVSISAVSSDDQISTPTYWKVYPNPMFGGQSMIVDWKTPASEKDLITISNLRGQVVHTLKVEPGQTSAVWDGKDAQGRMCPTGVYLVKSERNKGLGTYSKIVLMH